MTETTNTILPSGGLTPQNVGYAPTTVTTPVISTTTSPQWAPNAGQQFFTADDLERARQQEKDKLYGRLENQQNQINEFKSTVDTLMADKKARDDELAKQQKAAEDAARTAANEKLSAQELITQKQAEWEQRQAQLQSEWELKFTTMQKEQDFLRLKSYAQRRVTEEINAGNIIPDLAEYIDGDTESEIESAIEKAKEKTNSIVMGATRLNAPVPGGVSPTGGPSGPLDSLSGPREPSLEQLRNMNMKEYRQYREQRGLDRAGNGQGLFG